MSLEREVNQSELEREEDCDEEPATREDVPITIVGEADCCNVFAATTTLDYSAVGGDNRVKQGLLESLPGVPEIATDSEDTDSMFVRAIGPAWSQGTFQPPTQCQDWVREVVSLIWSFRNKTPTSQGLCHSTDCSSHSTDCTSFSTDCLGLPDKYVLPDVVKELPDVDKMFLLARVGRGIIDSEKTTWQVMPRSPVPEVAGLHAGPRCSQRTGSMD